MEVDRERLSELDSATVCEVLERRQGCESEGLNA